MDERLKRLQQKLILSIEKMAGIDPLWGQLDAAHLMAVLLERYVVDELGYSISAGDINNAISDCFEDLQSDEAEDTN